MKQSLWVDYCPKCDRRAFRADHDSENPPRGFHRLTNLLTILAEDVLLEGTGSGTATCSNCGFHQDAII